MGIQAVLNIEDQVLGSWETITVDQVTSPDEEDLSSTIRLDGILLPESFETHKAVLALLAAFQDDFGGITGSLYVHLAELL